MNVSRITILLALTCLTLTVRAQTSFTYQGRLTDNGSAPTGLYDFEFRLFSAASGGSQLGSVVTKDDVGVTNGLFNVTLDFGAGSFPGADRYLSITVRPGASTGSYTAITPRQAVTPTPYAITALNFGGTLGSAQLSGTYSGAVTLSNAGNSIAGNGAGLTGLDAGNLATGTVPAARLPANVAVTDASQAYTGRPAFNGGSSGVTPPFTVSSTTVVPNLDADLLDGQTGAFYQNAANLSGTLPVAALADNSIPATKLASDAGGLAKVTAGAAAVSGSSIGIGTPSPGAALDVRGDIKLGAAGNLFTTGNAEKLRIVRGIVTPTGAIFDGSGFTITKTGTGTYSITFNPPFTDAPALILTGYTAGSPVSVDCTGGSGSGFSTIQTWVGGTKTDSWFNLIAIGGR